MVSNQPPPPAGTSEEVVKLSPFEVTTDQDVGYLASNTLAGSRFNTSLKDTPASISVLTPEFLSDIGAFQIEEALQYTVNIEYFQDDDRDAINNNAIFTSYQTYRSRGLDAGRSRNYFTMSGRAVPDEMAFVDRIEDSRGANSILFGIGEPGGVLNTSTKQAIVGRAFLKGSATYGSYETKRAALDLNQPLLKGKLAVRLNLVYNDNNDFRYFQHQTHERGLLSVTYKLTDRTSIRAEFERSRLETNRPTGFDLTGQAIPWIQAGRPTTATQTAIATTSRINQNNRRVTYTSNDGWTIDMRGTLVANTGPGNVITDPTLSEHSVNFGGPAQNRFTHLSVFSAFLEQRLAKNTYLELGFNHSKQNFDNRDPRVNSNALLGDPNQKLNGANQVLNGGPANPYVGQLYLESNWFRTVRRDKSNTTRASLFHELDAGKWGNYRFAAVGDYEKQFLLTNTYREVWYNATTGALGPFNATPDNVQNNVIRRTYLTEGDWRSYHVDGPVGDSGFLENEFDPVSGLTLGSKFVTQGAPNESYTTKKSGMLITQARYFKERLIVSGGLRRDEFDSKRLGTRRNPDTQIFEIVRDPAVVAPSTQSATGNTSTLGAAYHVPMPERLSKVGVSLYYNQSNNVAVPAAGNFMLDPSGDPLLEPVPVPKPRGKSKDYSVGLSLFDGKIYLKATRYTTQARDQSVTSPSAVRTENTQIMDELLGLTLITQDEHDKRVEVGGQGLFGHESTGTEIQLTGNPTRYWRFQVNYSESNPLENYRFAEWLKWEEINKQFLSKFDQNLVLGAQTIAQRLDDIHNELAAQTAAVGIGKLGNRRYKYNFFTRCDFSSGWLKNVYIGGGYKHQSKMFVGKNSTTGEKLYGNAFGYADAMAGYKVPVKKGRVLSFQLNVYNVFNKHDPLITRYSSADPTIVFRYVVQPPKTWRVTTNFAF